MTPHNPLGFASADLLELALLAFLVAGFLLWSPAVRRWFASFASKTKWCLALLFVLPIALRLLLLPNHPVPHPDIYDEFSHLFLADTLLHLRLANPPHPLHQFFETFFILQQPTYSSIYSLGQASILALGRLLSGSAWTGVLISIGLFCSLCYWMLRAWLAPEWALAGGLLAVVEFGPLNLWTNCYWGGALPAAAGCLVFGALPRLVQSWRKRDAALLGLGAGLHCITRQFESTLLLVCILLFFVPLFRSRDRLGKLGRLIPYAIATATPFLILILLQNKAVTHDWLELPEQLSQYQYGVPTSLSFQPVPVPHLPLTSQQQLDYKAQTLAHGLASDSLSRFLMRLEFRVRYYRFFLLPALYLAVFVFLFALGNPRLLYVIGVLTIFALGTNLFPYLLPHYLAAVTCLFVLLAITGIEHISKIRMHNFPVGAEAARIIALICSAHFLLWFGLHLFENTATANALEPYETWDSINHGDPHGRIAINRQLAAIPGKLVVMVQYSSHHIFQNEWVWNAADIDSSRIIWARDLGPAENSKLKAYYPDREFLTLQPDLRPPKLERYSPE
ncbi:MAG: hypothetical protein JO051_16550 [Acidobacteriaceae bacterium]|nr:hypothetical protein [Acidobacteriaceae bacterium]